MKMINMKYCLLLKIWQEEIDLKVMMTLLNICVFVLNGHKKNCLNGKEDGMGTWERARLHVRQLWQLKGLIDSIPERQY